MIGPLHLPQSLALVCAAAIAAPAVCAAAASGKGLLNGFVAKPCGAANAAPPVVLALGAVASSPPLLANVGATVEVVSSLGGARMTYPIAHPANKVCEISQQRGQHGAAIVIYQTLRPGSVRFFSTYAQVNPFFMPFMAARLQVRPAQPASNREPPGRSHHKHHGHD
jgi:hypothetical protein